MDWQQTETAVAGTGDFVVAAVDGTAVAVVNDTVADTAVVAVDGIDVVVIDVVLVGGDFVGLGMGPEGHDLRESSAAGGSNWGSCHAEVLLDNYRWFVEASNLANACHSSLLVMGTFATSPASAGTVVHLRHQVAVVGSVPVTAPLEVLL